MRDLFRDICSSICLSYSKIHFLFSLTKGFKLFAVRSALVCALLSTQFSLWAQSDASLVQRVECGGEDPSGRWKFVTCMWFSPQECGWSCPSKVAYKIEENLEECPEENLSYACYCWTAN